MRKTPGFGPAFIQIAVGLVACLCMRAAQAQSTALPLLSKGKSEIAVTLQGGMTEWHAGGDRNRLYLAMSRTALGLWQRLDVFLLAGVVKQNVDYGQPIYSNYDSRNRWAFGGGLAFRPPLNIPGGISLYAGAQALLFETDGRSYEKIAMQNAGYRKRRDIVYDWVQIQSALHLARLVGQFEFFAGGEFTQISIDHRTKINLEYVDADIPVGRSDGLYLERGRMYAVAGVIMHLPARLQLGLSARASSRNDFAVFMGIGQTGSPD